MTLVHEEVYVEDLLKELQRLGWMFDRELSGYRSDFIEWKDFKPVFEKINGLSNFDPRDAKEILDHVKDFLSKKDARSILDALRNGLSYKIRGKSLKLGFISYDKVDSNNFKVARKPRFPGKTVDSEPDLVLYVNGIPLVLIEVKSPAKVGALEEALIQINRYEAESPDLFRFVQLAIAYVGRGDSVYRPTLPNYRSDRRFIHYSRWRSENNEYNILDLLRPERILEIIKWYTFFKEREEEKIVARYVQYHASERAHKLIRDYIEGVSDKNRGLIWHWQGSGKSYTMFFIAYRFFTTFFDRDPVVFFIVDRRELAEQLHEEFINKLHASGFKEYVRKIESIEDLKQVLKQISESERSRRSIERGVYITLIQKFRAEDLADIDPIEKKEILLLIDEAHRSQYGILASTMNRILRNAIKIAFTGTPVFKFDRNTFKLFAYPEMNEWYLHKYFIKDSIEDGYTLPIVYQVAVEKEGAKLLVEENEIRELIDKWLKDMEDIGYLDELMEDEGSVRQEPIVTRQEIRKRLNKIKVFLENRERLMELARYIAERIESDTEGFKFKAMIVTASRLACVRLRDYLLEELRRRYNGDVEKWVEVVMTYSENDPDEIREYKKKLLERWGESDVESINRTIQYKFKSEELPRILIVTDMLITGFDCPKLKVMYLDKPIYEHRLLQAIARVNRPYKVDDVAKMFGLVVDSVGLIEHVKKAVFTYENIGDKEIESDIRGSMRKLDDLYEEFLKNLDMLKKNLFDGVKVGIHTVRIDLNNLLSLDEESLKRELEENLKPSLDLLALGYHDPDVYSIIDSMKKVTRLYEALGAYPLKVNHYREYTLILYMYKYIIDRVRGRRLPREFWEKLLNHLHEKTQVTGFHVIKEYKIDTLNLEDLEQACKILSEMRTTSTASEALLSLRSFLELDLANPLYKHIYEHVRKLEEKWLKRGEESGLDELLQLYREFLKYHRERGKMSLEERILKDVATTIKQKYGVEVKLPNLKETLSGIMREYRGGGLLESQIKNLRKALIMDINVVKDAKEKMALINELLDYIGRSLENEYGKTS